MALGRVRLGRNILPAELPLRTYPFGITTLKNRSLGLSATLFTEWARAVSKDVITKFLVRR